MSIIKRMYQIIYSSDNDGNNVKTMLINLRFKYTKNDLDFHMTYLSFNDTIVTEN